MASCPSCGGENPSERSTCSFCDEPLADPEAPGAAEASAGSSGSSPGCMAARICGALAACGVGVAAILVALIGFGVLSSLQREAGDLVLAPVMSPAEVASSHSARVCLEGAVAEVAPGAEVAPDAGLEVPGRQTVYLYLRDERPGEARSVDVFWAGGVEVRVGEETEFDGAERIETEGESPGELSPKGIPAGSKVTVVGRTDEGAIDAELVSTQPSKKALVAEKRGVAAVGQTMAWVCTGVGVLAFVGVVLLLVVRR